jgi:putative membrane protein
VSGKFAIVVPLAVTALLYARGHRQLARRGGAERLARPGPSIACVAALGIILVALVSRLDEWGDVSFAAHMGQHLLIIVGAAPLLAVSRAPVVMLCALGMRARRALTWFAARSGWNACLHALARPAPAWTLFTGTFLFWHLPAAFNWAQRHESVHIIEHLTLLLAAWAFWSAVLVSARSHLSRGAAALFVVTAAVVLDLPSAVMIFSPRVYYASIGGHALPWHLSALQEQQVAGLLMWVPGSLVFYSIAIWLFAQWLARANRTELQAHATAQIESVTP